MLEDVQVQPYSGHAFFVPLEFRFTRKRRMTHVAAPAVATGTHVPCSPVNAPLNTFSFQEASADVKDFMKDKDKEVSKKGGESEKMESSSVKKRRRKARKSSLKPKKLFEDPGEEDVQEQPHEAPADAALEENLSEDMDPSSDAENQSAGFSEDTDVDKDVFGGAFNFKTPLKRIKDKKPEDPGPSSEPTVRSQGSIMDVSPHEAKLMQEVAEAAKKIEKRLLDCLPSKMNPFLVGICVAGCQSSF